ncbi:oxygen-dependent coproporphyrinogen oxidase [Myxococcota bacterium]|nr:oxygen-dependent coproporphyrinogen oxidase [Myxococcota bacterium]
MIDQESLSSGATPRGRAAHRFFLDVQDRITEALTIVDGAGSFRTEDWRRAEGGGGRSRLMTEGRVFEKGGVNVSCVFGELSESFAKELPGEGRRFFATGVSLVIHPRSPHVPTVHANFRYLEKGDGTSMQSWFGGGSDLTPWILYDEDAVHFHRVWHDVCARHPVADYRAWKKWCDDYFTLKHRQERRGIGGIFFDYLGLDQPPGTPADHEDVFRLIKDAAPSFLDAYIPIVERRKSATFSDEERDWQLVRRGRYVEFNLVYDRGTVFGLKTNGRAESILMSLPSLVRWPHEEPPRPGYQERLVEVLKHPRDWLDGQR